jgi:deoxyribodipyrimidine photo-lyase
MDLVPRAQGAARIMRPRLLELLYDALERVEDRPPRHDTPPSLVRSLPLEPLDLTSTDVRTLVAACEIDHDVPAVPARGGGATARERLATFLAHGIASYDTSRRDPNHTSSSLSPYLHFGQIAAAEVAREACLHADGAALAAFLDQLVVWRELALNLCARTAQVTSIAAIPTWARRSLAEHEHERETRFTLAELEAGATDAPLWNAAQRELVTTGTMHNAVRQLWGKSVVLWTKQASTALRRLVHLNDRFALDGRDPNGYANILWCFGKFDRPFPRRTAWGLVRPMLLHRAADRFDVDTYVGRWAAKGDRASNRRVV